MKKYLLAILLGSILLQGCYLNSAEEIGNATVSVELVAQDLPGGYQGNIFRVSLYYADSVSGILFSPDPAAYYDDLGTPVSTNYTVQHILPPIPLNGQPYEDFPADDPYNGPSSGSILIDGLVAGLEYKIVIETFGYYPGESTNSTDFAGISSSFTVEPNIATEITIQLNNYGV